MWFNNKHITRWLKTGSGRCAIRYLAVASGYHHQEGPLFCNCCAPLRLLCNGDHGHGHDHDHYQQFPKVQEVVEEDEQVAVVDFECYCCYGLPEVPNDRF